MIVWKVTKNQGFIYFLKNAFLEKPQGRVKLTLHPAILGLKKSLRSSSIKIVFLGTNMILKRPGVS